MRDYPNMSYVMFENTAAAVEQILGHMRHAEEKGRLGEFMQDLSRSERQAMSELWDMCQQFCAVANDAWEEQSQDDGQPSEHDEWMSFDPDC